MIYCYLFSLSVPLTVRSFRSHGTYYFIAAGCYFSLGNKEKAQQLLDAIMGLIDMKKMGGKDLPTEVLIKKKCECWLIDIYFRRVFIERGVF